MTEPKKTGASLARGSSKQDYETPEVLLSAVRKKFGVKRFTWDLAATSENAKARLFFTESQDSLKQDWSALTGDLWLNPPFSDIEPWAAKCAHAARVWLSKPFDCVEGRVVHSPRIFFLVPAAVGSNWHARNVDGQARVLFLNGRVPFMKDQPTWGYPKDVYLAVHGERPGYECWRWR
jgi:phage N-6-adenine-methyltransferase